MWRQVGVDMVKPWLVAIIRKWFYERWLYWGLRLGLDIIFLKVYKLLIMSLLKPECLEASQGQNSPWPMAQVVRITRRKVPTFLRKKLLQVWTTRGLMVSAPVSPVYPVSPVSLGTCSGHITVSHYKLYLSTSTMKQNWQEAGEKLFVSVFHAGKMN